MIRKCSSLSYINGKGKPSTKSKKYVFDNKVDMSVIENIGNQVIDGMDPSLVPTDIAKDIITYLKMKKSDFVNEGDYISAQEMDDICNIISQNATVANYNSLKGREFKMLQKKLIRAQERLAQAKELKERVISKLTNDNEVALKEFDMQQKHELIEYEKELANKPLVGIHRHSNEYFYLKKKEESMAASKRYLEAAQVRDLAEDLEREEAEKNEADRKFRTHKLKQEFILKQMNQRKSLEEKLKRKWFGLIPVVEAEEARRDSVVKNIENRIKSLGSSHQFGSLASRMRIVNYVNSSLIRVPKLSGAHTSLSK